MAELIESQYDMGLSLALEVISETGKTGAMSLLENICSIYPHHDPIAQAIRDVARDYINGGSIPSWMLYNVE